MMMMMLMMSIHVQATILRNELLGGSLFFILDLERYFINNYTL